LAFSLTPSISFFRGEPRGGTGGGIFGFNKLLAFAAAMRCLTGGGKLAVEEGSVQGR